MTMIGAMPQAGRGWAGPMPVYRRIAMNGLPFEAGEPDRDASIAGGQDDHDIHHTLVHSVSLSGFDRLVRRLGGDPDDLIAQSGLELAKVDFDSPFVCYRDFIRILDTSSRLLDCPSFGLQLAHLQSAAPMLPVSLDLAMRNSPTIGAAYEYSSSHLGSYSPVLHTSIECDRNTGERFFQFDVLLDRVPHKQQAIEHAVGLLHYSVLAISGGAVRPRAIWFKHERVANLSTYHQHFQTQTSFDMPANGIFLSEEDWIRPLSNRNPHLYDLAASFIESQFPAPEQMLSRLVRTAILRRLGQSDCTHAEIAAKLGLHPRTLQRRLREEGTSFEKLRDEIRREVALQYLAQPSVPLIRIAGMLGYSEQSVLTRSCYRWFAASPHKMRRELREMSRASHR